ncbi:cytochrome C oxidase subunit [Parasponia andersonii]|uniref:Cytochrome C oxidase subunit n=1 Tax=Parasponia andersonii TaxID=3476 RepID=A0A2P5DM84_PARAD|nr:cytochrome C oxidase subunit [Parasponia andersonii]
MASLQASYLSSFKNISLTKPTLFSSTNVTKAHPFKPFKVTFSLNSASDESQSSHPISPNSPDTSSEAAPAPMDSVNLAFAKAKEYKKSLKSSPKLKIEQNPVKGSDSSANGNSGSGLVSNGSSSEAKEFPDSAKIAMEKAREYNKIKGMVDGGINREEEDKISGPKETNGANYGPGTVEKEGDKKGKLSVSSIDFVGLNFADKKEGRGLPAGLVPLSDPFPEGDIPEVEIIVGDTIINPGEALETAEEKAAKDARTKELIAAYKRQFGMNIDPKLKSECEEALKDGDSLMNTGQLNEALPYYEKVMEKLPFRSKLHGLAALQWSICQDSLRRRNEARAMYEKLQTHPNGQVSKKARQFMFSFQAMEMMKFTTTSPYLKNTGYQNYFEAFVENKSNYPLKEVEDDVGSLSQTLPYIFFLVSPIFLVLLIAVQKRI